MKRVLPFLLLSFLFFWLTAPTVVAQRVDFSLSFHGKRIPNYICYQVLEPLSIIDSIEVQKNGKTAFSFNNCRENQFFRFLVNGQKLFMIVQPGENVFVDLNVDNLLDSKVLNSVESQNIIAGLRIVRDADPAKKTSALKSFMKRNPSLLSNVVLVEYLDFDADFKFINSIYGNMKEKSAYDSVPAFVSLGDRIRARKLLQKGAKVLDFKIPEIEGGREVGPSDFLGNDFALVIFAAWNRQSVSLTKKYFSENPGKKVLAVLLDGDRNFALSAIHELDNKNAIYCSDFKYFDSEVANLYGVTKLPFIIEVGPGGKLK